MAMDWRDVLAYQRRRGSRTHGPTRGRLRRGMPGEAQMGAFEGDRPSEARLSHERVTEEYKLSHGIKLNIYDAAHSYRVASGQESTSIRVILKQDEFRSAWRDFRGGGLSGGKPTSTATKLHAAETLGWYESDPKVVERLRNLSP